jgi:hypothetical protein
MLGRSGRQLPEWKDLTSEQRSVLVGAAEHLTLVEILNDRAHSPDPGLRTQHTSQLAVAARALADASLIEVYREHFGPGEVSRLPQREALAVLTDLDSWLPANS